MLCGRPLLLEIGSILWNVNFQSMWELQELESQSLTNGETGPNEENKSISSPRSTNSESSTGKSSVQNKQVRRAASKMKTRQYTYHLNPKERWDPNPLFLPGHGALQIQHISLVSSRILTKYVICLSGISTNLSISTIQRPWFLYLSRLGAVSIVGTSFIQTSFVWMFTLG